MKNSILKRAAICFLAAAFCILTAFAVLAEKMMELDGNSSQRVYDMAELLTEDEEETFEEVIARQRKTLDIDIVVVTIEHAGGKTSQEYADYNYEAAGFGNGSGHDGILLLIDMENRELVLSTEGKAIRIFTDERIEAMLDDIYEGASDGDFAASVEAFLEDTKYYGNQGILSNQYNYDTETHRVSAYKNIQWYEALLAVGIAAFVAAMACLSIKSQYEMKEGPGQARNMNLAYRADCKFAYQNESDILMNKFVTSQVIPRSTGSSGSHGGSFGGSSSVGRSSTHHSSSGRTHGGGSRKF